MKAGNHAFSRRRMLQLGGLTAASLALMPWGPALGHGAASDSPSPDEALQLLLDGNQRWAAGQALRPHQDFGRRSELTTGQQPFAVVFSCVDSRVPPELVFDQGLGDLLVIRTAGHVIDNAAVGSIEFGVEELHIPLVMVLGHQRCGAVAATLEALDHPGPVPGRIEAIVDGIRPAVEGTRGQPGDHLDNAVRANTQATVEWLRGAPPILRELGAQGRVKIVGGRYDLATGLVEVIA